MLANIKVVGVGGAGGNVITRMQKEPIRGVEFIAVNTDAQDLDYCVAHKKLYIGKNITRGLGAGMNPELGRQAAEESRQEIVDALTGADLVFVAAGTGGGTGSSASIVVAEIAKEIGALAIAVVTKPFAFEGGQRSKIAQEAIAKIKEKVDALIVIPNDRIFSIINKETSIIKAFEAIDEVLKNAVFGIAELITMPGIVNVDFADVRAVMQGAGGAIVGIGTASGKDRAAVAVNQAISSPLLETAIDGARGVLFSVSGSRDLKMSEVQDVAKVITESVDPSAKIIFGAYHDRKLRQGILKVTMIATNFNEGSMVVKKAEPSLTNLFGEKIDSFETPAYERMASRMPIEPTPEKKAGMGKLTSKDKEKEKEDEGKKALDMWDIPTFLRKKKK
ncbi:MAG: cell division protein FtsZ [Candidatus Pacebacteria bacterium]|nr:cell division protein FtsZ [Candidatus Paceibacterota bacterium]